MRNRAARTVFVAAQALPFVTMAEMVLFHSLWLAIPAFAAILLFATLKCRHCGLPCWDKSVTGTRLPVSPRVFDRCPRCGKPMLAD